MSITSGLAPRRYANGGMSEEEQFKEAMRSQVIAKIEERLGIEIPRGSREAEDALVNSIIGGATDLPISKRGDEITYGDNDGFSFYVNPEEEGAGVRYNKRFAQGGLAAYADGGDADSGFFNYQKTAEGSGANLRDFTDFIFDPTDPVDYLVAGLMIFPPAGIAAKLIQAGVKGKKLKDTMKKVDALKNAERGAGQKAKDLFTTNPAENIASANGLLLGPTRKTIPGAIGQLTLRNEAADLVTTNNRGIENIGPIELYSDEALAEIREDPSITKKGGIGELVEMGRDTKELYDLAKDPEIRGSMIDDMKSGIGNFFSGDQSTIDNDALDDATEDLDIVNANEDKKEKEKTMLEKLSELGGMPDTPTMSQGYMIEGSGISTPEIRRYEGGGIANMMPIGMAEGGSFDFSKLSSLGGMPDTPTMTPGSAIASANINTPEIKKGDPEALRDVKKDFDEFETDVESNYVNFAGGGIANMDPMMMAAGGIAKFAEGSGKKGVLKRSIKYLKDKADKAKDALNKAKKSETKKKETKKKETKTEKAKRILPPEVGALATPIIGAGKLTKEAIRRLGGEGGLGRGVARTAAYGTPLAYGAKALFGKDETLKPPKKPTDATVPEIEESDAMKDILYQNSLERATSAGRTEPSFIDYLASFPGSYTEKVGKDPEFARQMMAGFMAMMKPTEGYVPRNSLVDFGEAAMAEEVRQEGEIPDQIKLMKEFQNNPELADAYKKFLKSQEAYDPIQEQKSRAQIFSNLQEMIFGPGFEEDDIPINISTKQPAEPFNVYNEFLSLGGDQAALFALKDKYSME